MRTERVAPAGGRLGLSRIFHRIHCAPFFIWAVSLQCGAVHFCKWRKNMETVSVSMSWCTGFLWKPCRNISLRSLERWCILQRCCTPMTVWRLLTVWNAQGSSKIYVNQKQLCRKSWYLSSFPVRIMQKYCSGVWKPWQRTPRMTGMSWFLWITAAVRRSAKR